MPSSLATRPSGAFVVIVAGIIAKFGVSGLLVVMLMAGCLLVLMGVTGLGAAVKFIPRPVTIGFTNGIALLIASTQIKNFLVLTTPAVPSDLLGRMRVLLAPIVERVICQKGGADVVFAPGLFDEPWGKDNDLWSKDGL